jgi:septal ring factor EnvC (AmiA/AmiB activator)
MKDLETKVDNLSDERSRLNGQLQAIQDELAKRDVSLEELHKSKYLYEDLQERLSASLAAFEKQGICLADREKEFHT